MKPWITTLRASLPLLLMRFLAYGAMALCLSPCSQVFSLAMQLAGEDFIRQAQDNRYYAARETSAAPLLVKSSAGGQREKFLFYRGVSRAPLPISAKVTLQGTLLIKNLSKDEIPNALLFERREEKVGYRIG